MNKRQLWCAVVWFGLVIAASAAAQELPPAGPPNLPGEKQVQAIQSRMGELRGGRVTDLHWLDDGRLYFSRDGERWQVTLGEAAPTVTPAADEPPRTETPDRSPPMRGAAVARAQQRTVEPSPDGKWNAVYRDFNVVLVPSDEAVKAAGTDNPPTEIPVTDKGNEKQRFGTCCWVYGEELFQQTAMWWSPDSRRLAYYGVDEQHMRSYYLTLGNTNVYTRLHVEQYPTAGEKNPHVSLYIYDLESRSTTPVTIDGPVDQYLYNVRFAQDGSVLLVNRTNRWQNQLDVLAVDPATGQSRVVVSESQATWQDNSPEMRFLEDGQRFIWATERTGWKQYELRNLAGDLVAALSPPANYPCERIVSIDEEAGWFYYTAYSDAHPLNQHLHRARLDGSDHSQLTSRPLNHTWFEISPDHQWIAARAETVATPPVTVVYNAATGQEVAVLAQHDRQAADELGLEPPELFSFTADDGATTIYGVLHKPAHFDPSRKYPLIVDVYGGPQSRAISNRYQPADPSCEYGFLIARIDNRGTTGRGKAFESANYLNLGGVDLADQVAGVRVLCERPYVDTSRVGIYGHSYGGFMASLAILKHPDLFHVAVAGSPVTDWKNYDTIYTERYMRTPQENPEGYKNGSCLTYAAALRGRLLLAHGLVDDNVHPCNTWQLIAALDDADRRYDLLVYPNGDHGLGRSFQQLLWEYLVEQLRPEPLEIETGGAGTGE
jgi:dipeptidyl-peptidase-4